MPGMHRWTTILALILVASACADADDADPVPTAPTTASTSTAATPITRVFPQPTPVTTWLIREGVPDPVPFLGMPEREMIYRQGLVDDGHPVGAEVIFNDDWTSRRNLQLCDWAGGREFYRCVPIGTFAGRESVYFSAILPPGETTYELWLLAGNDPARRLLTLDSDNPPTGTFAFPEGWTNVSDVLTKPPPPGGDYLVPIADGARVAEPVDRTERRPDVAGPTVMPVDGPVDIIFGNDRPELSWSLTEAAPDTGGARFSLVACRLEWPGRIAYDIDVALGEDVDVPKTAVFWILTGRGDDERDFGFEVALTGGGPFTLIVEADDVPRNPESTTGTSTAPNGVLPRPGEGCELEDGERGAEVLTVVVKIDPPIVEAPVGSVQELLAFIDPADESGPLLVLADLLSRDDLPDFDRLWIAPSLPLFTMKVVADEPRGCVTISSAYRLAGSEGSVRLTQLSGNCAVHRWDGGSTIMGVVDDQWDVRLIGRADDIAELIEALTVLPMANAR
jgi:hypothetical protein